MIASLEALSFFEIIEKTISRYIKMYGEEKYRKVLQKIMTSNSISGFISKTKFEGVAPNHMDFLIRLNGIPFFLFSSSETQAMGGLLSLYRWHNEVNEELKMIDLDSLKNYSIRLIENAKAEFNF